MSLSKDDYSNSNNNNEKENKLNNLTKVDHWLLIIFGILSFVSASIWHYIFY